MSVCGRFGAADSRMVDPERLAWPRRRLGGPGSLYAYADQLRTVGQPIPEDCEALRGWFDAVNARPTAEASLWPEQPMGMRG